MARKMKDSGIEWIGEIPTDFSLYKLKYLLSSPLCYGANESGTLYSDILPRYIRITDISPNGTLKNSGMLSLDESSAQNYMLHEGDILFARSGATVGKSFIYHNYYGRAAYAGYLIKASFNRLVLPEFVYYYTCSSAYEIWKNSIFIQSTIQNIGADRYSNLPISVPNSIDKQLRIVRYLNNFCSKFDAIIYNLQTSIEDYKKLKQAVITQAVTTLNSPNVKLKYLMDIIVDCPHETPIYTFTGNYLVIRTSDQSLASLRGDEYMYRLDEAEYKKRTRRLTLDKDDIVYGREGSWGLACLVPQSNKYCLGQRVMQFRCNIRLLYPKYAMYALNSETVYMQGALDTIGSTAPHVNISTIRNYLLPVPTLTEQKEVADYLDAKCAEIDGLIAKKEQLVKELESYKKSLIYEVVTGKREV